MVDLDLSGDQQLLVETSTRFIESAYPVTAVRAGFGDLAGPPPSYRRQAAELGWFSMLASAEAGGGGVSDNAVADCALLAKACGATLQPLPFTETNVVVHALSESGSDEQRGHILPAVMAGESTATWAAVPGAGQGAPDAGVFATSGADGYVLSGSKTFVLDAKTADWILVTAGSEAGACQFLLPGDTPGMSVVQLAGLDVSRRFASVSFHRTFVPASALVGEPGRSDALIERQFQIACVLTAAGTAGAVDRDFAMAVQYAKDRVAFGRPIGSFQAVKHQLADASLLVEMSKAIVGAAAEAVGSASADLDPASSASMAKAFVGDSAITVAQVCFQVFGGIGYTWEHDQHLYLRRITTDAALYGDAVWHRERVCQLGGI